jgi:hypothetical protein
MYFLFYFLNFSPGFFKLCHSQVLYSSKGKKWEIEPKQEVKMTDNVVNTPCVALFLEYTAACQAESGEH